MCASSLSFIYTVCAFSVVASPKIWKEQKIFWGQNVWFQANNTILFRKTPIKAQNDYIFQKFWGTMAPLAPLATPMCAFAVKWTISIS